MFGPGRCIGENEQEQQESDRRQQQRTDAAQSVLRDEFAPAPRDDAWCEPPQQMPVRLHEHAAQDASQGRAVPGKRQPAETRNIHGITRDFHPAQTRHGDLQVAKNGDGEQCKQ